MLPEIGARIHGEHTTPTDFASVTPEVQRAIQALLPRLPDTAAATDNPIMRNYYQFMDRRKFAPRQDTGESPFEMIGANECGPLWGPTGKSAERWYGEPGYDYAASGYPEPGKYIGTESAFWQQLMNPQAAPATARKPAAPAPDPLAAALTAHSAPANTDPMLATQMDEMMRRVLRLA
jgi:hypothetical protein